ncbi:MAG: hypothetical protein ACKOEM_03490 [Planctomycetia bacterium]
MPRARGHVEHSVDDDQSAGGDWFGQTRSYLLTVSRIGLDGNDSVGFQQVVRKVGTIPRTEVINDQGL